MNTLRVTLFGLILLLFFSGCKKEEDSPLPPTIEMHSGAGYVSGDMTVDAGSGKLKIKATVKKGANEVSKNIDKVTFSTKINGNALPDSTVSNINLATYVTQDSMDVPTEAAVIVMTMTVRDLGGLTASKTITLTVKKGSPTAPRLLADLELSNPAPYISLLATDPVWEKNLTHAPDSVDMVYFYSGVSKCNLASPLAASDSTKYYQYTFKEGSIKTEYRMTTMSAADFDALNDETLLLGKFNAGTLTTVDLNAPGTRFNEAAGQFVVGKVIAFKNEGKHGTKYGLILLKKNGTSDTDPTKISIKVQN